jgi:thymidylate kinase
MGESYTLKDNKKESNISKNKALIIEFVGPPGAGKTTSCRYFDQQLKEKGLRVATLQDIKGYLRKMSSSQKLLMLSKALLFRGHILLLYTASLALNRIYSVNSIYRYFRLTMFDLALKKFVKDKNVDIVLLEQWVIQELWSATIFKLKSYDKLKEHLARFYFKTDFVLYFDIDVAVASERIAMRNTNLSRFDRMDASKRFEELMKYSTYLYQLYENSDCERKYIYSTEHSPEKNAESFVQHLNLSFNYI